MIIWCDKDKADGIDAVIAATIKRFPDEGIKIFRLAGEGRPGPPLRSPAVGGLPAGIGRSPFPNYIVICTEQRVFSWKTLLLSLKLDPMNLFHGVLRDRRKLLFVVNLIIVGCALVYCLLNLAVRGINSDVILVGGTLPFFLLNMILARTRLPYNLFSTLTVLLSEAFLLLSVFIPFTAHIANLYFLMGIGGVCLIVSALIGDHIFQLIMAGGLSAAAQIVFFFPLYRYGTEGRPESITNLGGSLLLTFFSVTVMIFFYRRLKAVLGDLETAKTELEEKVAARTEELSRAMESLKAAQTRLAEEDRLSTLGQLIAGIAHEINSTLTATHSALALYDAGTEVIGKTMPRFISFPDRLKPLVGKLFVSARLVDNRIGGDNRNLIAETESRLKESGLSLGDSTALRLVELGWETRINELKPLLAEAGDPVMEWLHAVGMVRYTRDILGNGNERALEILRSMRTYLYSAPGEHRVPVDLSRSIDAALVLFRHKFKGGVTLVTDYGEVPPVPALSGKLGQIWMNLIGNALHAMDYRGTLSIAMTAEEGDAVVRITDSGPGIPEEKLFLIFDPFYTTKKEGEGTGLGLAIVKKIVMEHNGSIGVESRPGETRFAVRLPLKD
jgi:signal transduction histidine kinase